MRMILLALALFGVVFYISNPQAFGAKKNFQLSGNGRVARNNTGGANVDFTKIGEFGADIFNRLVGDSPDSQPSDAILAKTEDLEAADAPIEGALAQANDSPQVMQETSQSAILSAIETPDLSNHEGRLRAIVSAMQNAPEATTAEMFAATTGCLGADASPILANYFVGLVQLVAETAQMPEAQRAANFKSKSSPLTSLLKAWLISLPEADRTTTTQELRKWAAQPTELVACHMVWLDKG